MPSLVAIIYANPRTRVCVHTLHLGQLYHQLWRPSTHGVNSPNKTWEFILKCVDTLPVGKIPPNFGFHFYFEGSFYLVQESSKSFWKTQVLEIW